MPKSCIRCGLRWEARRRPRFGGPGRALWHPEIEYHEDPRWPGATAYRGRDQVVAAWNGYLETGAVNMQLEKILDAGDEPVALIRVTGVSKGADVPVDHTWAYVCRIRDGQLAYRRAYWDPQEALASTDVAG